MITLTVTAEETLYTFSPIIRSVLRVLGVPLLEVSIFPRPGEPTWAWAQDVGLDTGSDWPVVLAPVTYREVLS